MPTFWDPDVDWQSNLDNWKAKRRSASTSALQQQAERPPNQFRAANVVSTRSVSTFQGRPTFGLDDEEPVFDGVGKPEVKQREFSLVSPSMVNHTREESEDASTTVSVFSSSKQTEEEGGVEQYGVARRRPSNPTYGAVPAMTVAPSQPHKASPLGAANKFSANSMEDSGHYGSDEIDGQSSRSSSVSSGERPKSKFVAKKRQSDRVENDFDSFVKQNAAAAIHRTEAPRLPPPPASAPPKSSGVTMNFPPQQMWKWKQKSIEKKLEELNVCLKQKPNNDKGFGFSVKGGAYQGDPIRLSAVIAGSRADRAGLEVEDELVSLDGLQVAAMPLAHANQLIKEAVEAGVLEMTLRRFKVLQPPPPSYHISASRQRRPPSPRSTKGVPNGIPRSQHHKSESSLIAADSRSGSAQDFRADSPYSEAAVDDKSNSQYIRNQNDKATLRMNRLKSDREWTYKQRAQSSSTGHLNEALNNAGQFPEEPVNKRAPPMRRYHPGRIENFVPDAERMGLTGGPSSTGDYAVSALHSKRAPGKILNFVPDSERPKTVKEIEFEKSSKYQQEIDDDDVHWEKEREFIMESFGHSDQKAERVLSPSPIRNFRLSDHTSRPLSVKTSDLSPQPPSDGKVMQSGAKPHSPRYDEYKPRSPTPSPRSNKPGATERGKSPASLSSSLSPHSSPIGALNSSSNYSPSSSASPSRPLIEEMQKYGDKTENYNSSGKPTPHLLNDSSPRPREQNDNLHDERRGGNKSSSMSPQRDSRQTYNEAGKDLQYREEQLLRARNELLNAVGNKSPSSPTKSTSSISPKTDILHRQQDAAHVYLNGDPFNSPPLPQLEVTQAANGHEESDDGEICFSKMPLPWEKNSIPSPSDRSPHHRQEKQRQARNSDTVQDTRCHDAETSEYRSPPQINGAVPLSAASLKPAIQQEQRSMRTPSPSPASATSAIPYHAPSTVQRVVNVVTTAHNEQTSRYQASTDNEDDKNRFSFDFNQSATSSKGVRDGFDNSYVGRDEHSETIKPVPARDLVFSPSYQQTDNATLEMSKQHDHRSHNSTASRSHDSARGHAEAVHLSHSSEENRSRNSEINHTKYLGDPALDYLNFEQTHQQTANRQHQQEQHQHGHRNDYEVAEQPNQHQPQNMTGVDFHKRSAAQFLSNRIPKSGTEAPTQQHQPPKYNNETHWLVQEAAGYNAITEQMSHERSTANAVTLRNRNSPNPKNQQSYSRTQATPSPDYYNINDQSSLGNQYTHRANHINAQRQSSHSPMQSPASRGAYPHQTQQQSRSAQPSPRPQFPPPAHPTRTDGKTHKGDRQKGDQQQEASSISVSGRQQCSHCGLELGRGAAMIIESLNLFYHLSCFHCYVCATPLGSGVQGTDVRVRNGRLHCQKCYSNDETGLQFSEV